MKKIILAALLALSACASPDVSYKPVEVQVPVSAPIKVAPIPVPPWPTDSVAPDASMFDRTKSLLAEIELRRGYEARLEAALRAVQ